MASASLAILRCDSPNFRKVVSFRNVSSCSYRNVMDPRRMPGPPQAVGSTPSVYCPNSVSVDQPSYNSGRTTGPQARHGLPPNVVVPDSTERPQ